MVCGGFGCRFQRPQPCRGRSNGLPYRMNSGPRAAPSRRHCVLPPTPATACQAVGMRRGATRKGTQMTGSDKGSPGNPAKDREKTSQPGHAGGQHQGKETSPANPAHTPEKAAEAGRAGGQAQGKEQGPGTPPHDRDKTSEAGRKGGQS